MATAQPGWFDSILGSTTPTNVVQEPEIFLTFATKDVYDSHWNSVYFWIAAAVLCLIGVCLDQAKIALKEREAIKYRNVDTYPFPDGNGIGSFAHALGTRNGDTKTTKSVLYQRYPNCKSIDLANNDIHTLDGFSNVPALQRLNLSSNDLKTVAGMGYHPNLQYLNLSDNDLKSIEDFEFLPQLKWVDLSNNDLTDVSKLGSTSPHVQYLNVSNNDLTELAFNFNGLKWVDAHNNDITKLEGLGNCNQLTHLDLSSNNLSCVADSISKCTKLQYINLANNKLVDMNDLVPLANLPSIRHVDLRNNSFNKEQKERLKSVFGAKDVLDI